MIRRVLAATAAVTTAAAVSFTGASVTHASAAHAAVVKPIPASAGYHLNKKALKAPPTTADCQAAYGINCYSPNQIEKAYNLAPLFGKGITGAGHTIAIVDSYGSPTIARDLATFDKAFGLPAPPSLSVIAPAGKIPAFDPTNDDMTGWAFEATLDVEYAHAMAPGANILLVETPVSETEGVTGFPEMVKAENYVINNRLADVISQSFGATEETFPSKQSLLNLRSAVKNAQRNHVTVLGASGDDGATDAMLDGTTLYDHPVQSWPSADPLVTSVGGTQLHLDAAGNHVSPDTVWNDGYGAGGGGDSEYFSRPLFQYGVKKVVGSHRGTPDISMSAAVDGGVIVYTSYDAADTGFGIVGGTSEATPIFSGVVALADQVAGRSLGDLNTALYLMDKMPNSGIVDVTSGNNSYAGVTGDTATKGYDMASGVGTINAAMFVPKLAVVAAIQ